MKESPSQSPVANQKISSIELSILRHLNHSDSFPLESLLELCFFLRQNQETVPEFSFSLFLSLYLQKRFTKDLFCSLLLIQTLHPEYSFLEFIPLEELKRTKPSPHKSIYIFLNEKPSDEDMELVFNLYEHCHLIAFIADKETHFPSISETGIPCYLLGETANFRLIPTALFLNADELLSVTSKTDLRQQKVSYIYKEKEHWKSHLLSSHFEELPAKGCITPFKSLVEIPEQLPFSIPECMKSFFQIHFQSFCQIMNLLITDTKSKKNIHYLNRNNFYKIPQDLNLNIAPFRPLTSPLLAGFMEHCILAMTQENAPGFEIENSDTLELLKIADEFPNRFPEQFNAENEDGKTYALRLLGILCDHAFAGPHTVHIDITSRCNTRCIFCGYHTPLINDRPWAANGWDQKQLDWELFEPMIRDLKKLRTVEDILLTGGGEPLLHPKILDMIEHIKAQNMHIILFTNGLLLNKNTAESLVDLGLDKMYWSIHSASPETWMIQHPGSTMKTFPMVIDQMRHLLAYRNKQSKKHPVIVFVNVLSALNVHEAEKIVELACDLKVDEMRFQIMHYGNEQTNHLMLTEEHLKELYSKLPKMESMLKEAGIPLLGNFRFQIEQLIQNFNDENELKSCDWAFDLYNRTGCWAGWFFSRTWVDGRMSFCCHDRVIGNLNEGGFETNWNSKKYNQARSAARSFDLDSNLYLREENRGGWLLAKDCSWCGNYEFMNRAWKSFDQTGLKVYLKPVSPVNPELLPEEITG
jgi:MoaA/NifB/PqqE/SkfB family radical SAM enzyme